MFSCEDNTSVIDDHYIWNVSKLMAHYFGACNEIKIQTRCYLLEATYFQKNKHYFNIVKQFVWILPASTTAIFILFQLIWFTNAKKGLYMQLFNHSIIA